MVYRFAEVDSECLGGSDSLHYVGKANKGLTLSEVEATEGGTVKESLVTSAQHKRALQRKRKAKNAGCH